MANSAVVGTLRAVLSADTAEFASAMKKAGDAADETAKDMIKAAGGFKELEVRASGITRLMKDFSGSFEARTAKEWAVAIEALGGAARLSESELRRASGVFQDYISKADAMGDKMAKVPPEIRKLAAEIDQLSPSLKKSGDNIGFLDASWAKLTAAFSATVILDRVISAIANFGRAAIESASNLLDLSAKTGLSTDALQVYGQVAKETGSTVDDIAQAVFKLGVNIESGGAKTVNAFRDLGLSIRDIQGLKPEAQFELIAERLKTVTNEQERNRIGVELFGKSWATVAPAVVQGLQSIKDQTVIVTNESLRKVDEYSERWERFLTNLQSKFTETMGKMLTELDASDEGWSKFFTHLDFFMRHGVAGHEMFFESLRQQKRAAKEAAAAVGEIAKPVTDYVKAVAEAREEIARLTPEQLKQLQAAKTAGEGFEALAASYGLGEIASRLFGAETKKTTKEMSEQEKQLKALEDAYQNWANEATGAKLLRDLATLETRLARLTKEGGLNAKAQKAIADEAAKLGVQLGFLPPKLQTVVNEYHGLAKGVVTATISLPPFSDKLSITGEEFRQSEKDVRDFNKAIADFQKLITKPSVFTPIKVPKGGEIDMKTMVAPPDTRFVKALEDTLFDAANEFDDMLAQAILHGEGIGEAFKALFVKVGAGIGASLGKSLGESLAAEGSKLGKSLGSAFGAIGGVLGELAFAGLSKAWTKATRNVGRDMQDAFATTELGFENLAALNEELKRRGAFDLVNRGDRAQRKDDEKDTRKWMEDVKKFLDEADQKAQALASRLAAAFDELSGSVVDFGGKAPAALQPFIQELLKSTKLTEDQRLLLQGLAGAPEWQQLQSIAEKYGISLGSLGQQFQESRLGDIAMQYARDFMTLRDAGGDVNGILEGMKDEVQALVLDSLKFGVALPEALRDVVTGLIAMGGLTDENGDKLEDLSRINFKGTIEDAFIDIKNILEDIRDLLAQGIPGAAEAGARGIGDAFKDTEIEIPVKWNWGDMRPPEGFGVPAGFDSAQSGGVVSKTGLVNVHAGEVIQPLDPMSSEDRYTIYLDNYLDGRKVTETVLIHTREVARRIGVRPI